MKFLHRHCEESGIVRVNKQPVELCEAGIALWSNVRGERDALQQRDPTTLHLPEGGPVHKEGTPYAPRLPLISMQALVRNGLMLTIDGDRKQVAIRRRWLWRRKK